MPNAKKKTVLPLNIEHLQRQWPARLVGSRVVSFARTQDFDLPGEFANLRSDGRRRICDTPRLAPLRHQVFGS